MVESSSARHATVSHPAAGLSNQPAMRVGSIIYADPPVNPYGPGRRLYWLPDYGVQIVYEPWGWHQEWYVDMVEITHEDAPESDVYAVRDMEVDIIVQGNGPTYRVIDLEKFGDRVLSGEFRVEEVWRVLTGTQRFLDAFLHRGAPWPPPAIAPLFSPDHDYPGES